MSSFILFFKTVGKLSLVWFVQIFAYVIISIVIYALLFQHEAASAYLFLGLPLILIASLWFGPTGATNTTLIFSFFTFFIYIYSGNLPGTQSGNVEAIILLDIFLIVLGITSLSLTVFYQKERSVAPTILLLSGWFISAWLYQSLHSAAERVDEISIQELIADSENLILTRYSTYIDALRASAAFYRDSDDVNLSDWEKFVNKLDLVNRYPGINGLGVVKPLRAQQLKDYLSEVRADGLKDFTLKSINERNGPFADRLGYSHYVVDQIAPLELNKSSLGLDLSTEEQSFKAAVAARDNGEPSISESILLEVGASKKRGFLIFMPMFKEGAPTDTIDKRREAFTGWTYAPFITKAFYEGIIRPRNQKIDFAVFESEQVKRENLIYKTNSSWEPLKKLDYESLTRVTMGQRTYSIAWKRGVDFSRSEIYSASIAAASVATGTSFLAGIVISLLTTSRTANRIVDTRTAELRRLNDDLRNEVEERKSAEKSADNARRVAEAASLAKSEFLATMSHEIRTPMNSVLGFAELLNATKLTAEQRLWTNYIHGSGQSLLSIINDILDFSKIEAGKMTLEQVPYSVDESTEGVINSFRLTANEKGLTIDLNRGNDSPKHVIGDPIRYKQITTNLIGNALKFTERGTITVSTTWAGDAQNGILTLSVKDTGVGISEAKLKTLFQKFTQVDSSTTRKFGGTGLGLAISKNLTELMGGSIVAKSQLGSGTIVTVKLPFTIATESEMPEPRQPKEQEAAAGKNYGAEVLLVDDNKMNQKLGMTILKRLGCKVALANDGLEAVEAVKKKVFAVVFMDCRMPNMDGFQATRKIRELETEGLVKSDRAGKLLPIVALTANITELNRLECIESGMNDLYKKPCKINDFSNALETYWVKS